MILELLKLEMDEHQTKAAFAALAQETRLRVVGMLVKAVPDGIAAGAIAEVAPRCRRRMSLFTSQNWTREPGRQPP